MVVIVSGCGEPEDNNSIEEFNIIGKWAFQKVSGDGVIFGLPQSDTDDNPVGYIEFFPGGQGVSEFSMELLSQTIATNQSIQWEWIDENVLDIEEEDGVHQTWQLINANDNFIEASWDIEIASNTATITAELIR